MFNKTSDVGLQDYIFSLQIVDNLSKYTTNYNCHLLASIHIYIIYIDLPFAKHLH
jgi:hypothetical protein